MKSPNRYQIKACHFACSPLYYHTGGGEQVLGCFTSKNDHSGRFSKERPCLAEIDSQLFWKKYREMDAKPIRYGHISLGILLGDVKDDVCILQFIIGP